MTFSPTTRFSFDSIEQMDEKFHALGWQTEYRQLDGGNFSSRFTLLEGDSWFLVEEQSSHAVEVQAPAPEGMYVVALTEGAPGSINGQKISNDHLIVQGSQSDFRVTLHAGTKIPQISIQAAQFENMLRAVAPWLAIPRNEVISIATTPGSLEQLRGAMRSALFDPPVRNSAREEAVSSIVAELVAAAAGHGKNSSGRRLHRNDALRALNRAREYIEANLTRTIRVASLCQHAGTSLSTLERTFTREMGMSPQQYVKVRRLNAVRSHLLKADAEQGYSVTELALSHGFSHLGRFAGEYFHHFGEYPRQTLNLR